MAASEAYMLPRDAAESQRLDWQHWWMKAISHDKLLHQAIPIQSARAVADVATGTGAWIRDALNSWISLGGQENVEFAGFDISSSQFPPVNAPNLHFCVHDATQPFPREYRGKFDVVNVRLVSYAIKVDELHKLVQNITEILRPGGYLQWQECDAVDAWASPESESSRNYVRAVVVERQARGLFPAIVSPLVKAIEAQTLSVPSEMLNPMTWTEQALRIMQLNTISTEGHQQPFVRSNTTLIILKTCLSLLRSGVERRKYLAEHIESPRSESSEDQLIAKTAADLELRLESGSQSPASDTWNCEMTWIVARKSSTLRQNEAWMSARYGISS